MAEPFSIRIDETVLVDGIEEFRDKPAQEQEA